MIFETHAHYDDKKFDPDRKELLLSMQENGIDKIVNIGCDKETCEATIDLMNTYDFVYGAMGVHPSDIRTMDEELFSWIGQQLSHPKVVAVGEIGLDYYWDKEEEIRKQQRVWFIRQLHLAAEADLPVIIHSRDAAEDTLNIMKREHFIKEEYARQGRGGVIHCFSYSKEIAREYVKMGYYIGIGGVSTFKNAKKLKEVITETPLEQILLETDCPYMAPEPHRGKRNSSLYLPYVVEQIARLKDVSPKEVEDVTYRNAMRFFRLEDEKEKEYYGNIRKPSEHDSGSAKI